jgi:hypothetical protein
MPSLTLLFNRAREVDRKTANELRDSSQYGTQVNSRNDLLNRMSRNTQRRANTAQKSKALKEENNIVSELCSKIDDEKNSRKLSITRQKELSDELSSLQATSAKPKRMAKACAAPTLELTLRASSSGRVTSTSKVKGKARAAADPYPGPVMGECNVFSLQHHHSMSSQAPVPHQEHALTDIMSAQNIPPQDEGTGTHNDE